jgi:hypothetical protein
VTLGPGATAHAVLAYGNSVVGNSGSTTYAALLRVYPPNQFQAAHAFWSLRSIVPKGVNYLRVGPVEAGIGVMGSL